MSTIHPSHPPKSPGLAAFLSWWLLGGGGHIYLGQKKKGIILILVALGSGCLLFYVPTIIIAIFGAYDAYRIGKALQSGQPVGEMDFFWKVGSTTSSSPQPGSSRGPVWAWPQSLYEFGQRGYRFWVFASLAVVAWTFIAPTVPSAPLAVTATSAPRVGAPTAVATKAAIQPGTSGTIKIAILAPVSGQWSALGLMTRDGALMAVDEWNAKGGVLGKKIVPVVEDSQCTAESATKAANKVIDQDKVNYIIGEVCSAASIPVSEIANSKKILQISPASTRPEVTVGKDGKVKDYVFRASFIDAFQGKIGARFTLGTLKARTAFILYDPSYTKSLADAFEQEFTANGGLIVGKETYSSGTTNFAAILGKVDTAKPGVVYLPDLYNVVNLVTKQAKDRGLSVPFLGGDGWDSSELDLKATDGGYFTQHYSPQDPRPETQQFVKAFGAKYKDTANTSKTPDLMAGLAYDATNLLLQAIKQAGADDPTRVKDTLARISFAGLTGKMTFDASHNPVKPAVVMKIKDGKVLFNSVVDPMVLVSVAVEPTRALMPTPARSKVLRLNVYADALETIDPALALSTGAIPVVESTFVSLVRLDEVTSEPHPGLASLPEVSSGGKVYTFRLRKDVPWVKYDPVKKQVAKVQDCSGKDRLVTAKDFEYGILRMLDPKTESGNAFVLTPAIQGADEFNSGKSTDKTRVGVKAIDDWTLQVAFREEAVYDTAIMGQWFTAAVPKWVIEGDSCTPKRGDQWTAPGSFQSYGSFTLKEWSRNSKLVLIKNPFWPGDQWTPQAKMDEITFSMLDDTVALNEFKAGNLDVVGVLGTDLERVRSDSKLSGLLKIQPDLCTAYYGFNTKAPVVNDARVRRALSMAIDRRNLTEAILKDGQEPAQWFVRPGSFAAPILVTHPNLGIKHDPVRAKVLLTEYLKERNTTADQLSLTLLYSKSSRNQSIAQAIQQMWKQNLGLNVKLTEQELATYYDTVQGRNAPQIWRSGWCMDFPDADSFTRAVFAVGGRFNPADSGVPYGGVNWRNAKFEDLVKQAALEKNPSKRVDLYAQAEQILVYEDAVMIPLYWYTHATLTQPWVQRTFAVDGRERYEKWSVSSSSAAPTPTPTK